MSTLCAAVLLDTVSIQKYVFNSNQLRENLGGSYLVKKIYEKYIQRAVEAIPKLDSFQMDLWATEHGEIKLQKGDCKGEVGFIGGGKALLLFAEETDAREFVMIWTRILLVEAPGLITAVAIKESFDYSDEMFQLELIKLFSQLANNKNRCFPVTTTSSQGITSICSRTGLSIEGYLSGKLVGLDKDIPVSSVSMARMKAAQDDEVIKKEENKKTHSDFVLSNKLEELGQMSGRDSHIAIVHADANGMGNRFKSCRTLKEYRELSTEVAHITEEAFDDLLKYIADDLVPQLKKEDSGFVISMQGDKKILPIRPIIIGGDDITFVCDGRLGVHLAEKLLRIWTQKILHLDNKTKEETLSACAGIAIIKSKYPFYRGYELAEELCSSAKKEARRYLALYQQPSSWLDFHLAYGGISGSLQEIRDQQLNVGELRLHYGPYLVSKIQPEEEKDIRILKAGMRELSDETKWPRSKIKEFRSTMYKGTQELKLLVQEMKVKKRSLPVQGYLLSETYENEGCANGITPYHDMVELLEYYPEFLLGGE